MDALNYPYIRVRDVDWLKKTLLLFPHVARMIPRHDAPDDAPEIEPFVWTAKGRNPLLRPVDLYSHGVHQAQRQLIDKIEQRMEADPTGFRAAFGREGLATYQQNASARDLWGQRLDPNAGFQLHYRKMMEPLVHVLQTHGLAWWPVDAHGAFYLEMHPRLGAAVMTTLAFAAAREEGLKVVTEFPDLHGRIIGGGAEGVLDRIIDDRAEEDAFPAGAQQLAEVIVYQRCDVSALNAEDIVALGDERAAFARFRQALEDEAKALPPQVGNPEILQEYLNDTVNSILAQWRKDRAGFTPLAKAVFGDDAITEPKNLLQKIAEKALTTEVAGPTLIGGLTTQAVAGAAAGCAIGLAVHTLKSWRQVRSREVASPWKYLTMLERGGVGFTMTA